MKNNFFIFGDLHGKYTHTHTVDYLQRWEEEEEIQFKVIDSILLILI